MLTLLAVTAPAVSAGPARTQSPDAPRLTSPSLVVVLVADQFRGDYVDR